MFFNRPQIKSDDGFLSKIIKYIPAEIIAVYTAIIGVLKQGLDSQLPKESDVRTYFIVFLVIIILTPIWTYLSVIDNPNIKEPPSKKKRALFHAVVATISFIIWVYAIGDILFKSWLCKCYFPSGSDCFDQSGNYNSVLGSIILILYTGLIVPLFERIILGKPIPPSKGTKKTKAEEIIDECKVQIAIVANQKDCNKFVKAVSSKFGVNFIGDADQIVQTIEDDPTTWTIFKGDGAGVSAKEKADEGWLVIGGLKKADTVPTPPATTVSHGHVVIVVSGDLAHSKYPTGYWGSLGGSYSKPPNNTINYAWNTLSRDKVVYGCKKLEK